MNQYCSCCIDATDDPGLCNLVNDRPQRFANSTMKLMVVSGKAHLI